jgi:hypothetical protein
VSLSLTATPLLRAALSHGGDEPLAAEITVGRAAFMVRGQTFLARDIDEVVAILELTRVNHTTVKLTSLGAILARALLGPDEPAR